MVVEDWEGRERWRGEDTTSTFFQATAGYHHHTPMGDDDGQRGGLGGGPRGATAVAPESP